MKTKSYIIAALILIGVFSIAAYQTLPDSKKAKDTDFLIKAGFKNIPSIVNQKFTKEKKFWYEKGYRFLTWDEFNTLQRVNGFISSTPENYIGEVPDSVVEKMRLAYDDLEDYLLTKNFSVRNRGADRETPSEVVSKNDLKFTMDNKKYYHYDIDEIFTDEFLNERPELLKYNESAWDLEPYVDNAGLYISAHHSKFKEGTISDTAILKMPYKPDPIVYIKQRKGVVIIAQW